MRNKLEQSHSDLYYSLVQINNILINKRKVTKKHLDFANKAIGIASEIEKRLVLKYYDRKN